MNGHEYTIKATALMSSGKSEELFLQHFISDEDAEKIIEVCLSRHCCDEDSTLVEEASMPLFEEIEAHVTWEINMLSNRLRQECLTYVWDAPEELWNRANERM